MSGMRVGRLFVNGLVQNLNKIVMNRPDKFLINVVAFGSGIFISSFFFIGWFWILIALVLFCGLGLFFFLFQKKLLPFVLLVFSLVFGVVFYQTQGYFARQNSSAPLNSQGVISVKAVIDNEPEIKDSSLWLQLKLIDGLQGRVLANVRPHLENFQYGDEVAVQGKFEEPKNYNDFDFRAYLAKDGIYSVVNYPKITILEHNQGSPLKSFLFKIKNQFQEKINNFLPEPEAGFLAGLILGERQSLNKDLKANLQKSGTSHLIALSGYNITIIIGAVLSLFLFLGLHRSWAFCFSIIIVILFVLMTGASASIVRAAIMGILAMFGQRIGRLYHSRNALFLAALIMTILNPKIIRFDFAFQLSFMATLGLIYFGPLFEKIIRADIKSFLNWRGVLALTLSAQAAVLPLLISRFGYFSLVAPLTNILILIFIPTTMLFGFLTGISGFIFSALGQILAWFSYPFLKYEISVINFFGSLKFSGFNLGSWREAAFWLAVGLVALLFVLAHKRSRTYAGT